MTSKEIGTILANKILIEDSIYLMSIKLPNIVKDAVAGQFVEVKTGDKPLLRKPISIFDVDKENGVLYLLYQIRGLGTKNMSTMEAGEEIDVIGPLGNGFTTDISGKKALLVGGGIGIAPLYYLGRELKDKDNNISFVLGFNSKVEAYGIEVFKDLGKVEVSTMDGSLGVKGHIGSILDNMDIKDYDIIYSCGPEPMLNYLKKFQNDIDIEMSLEAYMGCGLGACLSCVCEKVDGSYERVCKEGPVFKGKEVKF